MTASLAYARSLYASGFGPTAIAAACGLTVGDVDSQIQRRGWRRRTPFRPHAVLLRREPVLVRCASCFATYGDVAGDVRRACPRCDQSQLTMGVAA